MNQQTKTCLRRANVTEVSITTADGLSFIEVARLSFRNGRPFICSCVVHKQGNMYEALEVRVLIVDQITYYAGTSATCIRSVSMIGVVDKSPTGSPWRGVRVGIALVFDQNNQSQIVQGSILNFSAKSTTVM